VNRIYLSGGIGNQLFQISFAHFLQSQNNSNVQVVKLSTNKGPIHSRLSFFQNSTECSHCELRINRGMPFFNDIINPWNRSQNRSLGLRVLDYRHEPFIKPLEIELKGNRFTYLGYFQNKEFVLPIQDSLISDIKKILTNYDLPSELMSKDFQYEVIHIRQGDTKTFRNLKRVGILSGGYYSSVLLRKIRVSEGSKRIVITDDKSGAHQVLRGIKYDALYGPDDLSPYQALKVMASAGSLITANSTFSWWGGLLAMENGAEVIIPQPFFISPELSADEALAYPGFSQAHSSFIN
jgi:Glycosyl transferase family 11